MKIPSPATTLAIILGASYYPFWDSFSNQALQQSAVKIEKYLLEKYELPEENLKNLFNNDADEKETNKKIAKFINERAEHLQSKYEPATDLFFFYIGHGGFLDGNKDFFFSDKKYRKRVG